MASSRKKFAALQEPIAISIPPENRLGMNREILNDINERGNSAFLVTGVALAKRKKIAKPELQHLVLELKAPKQTFYVSATKVKPRGSMVPVFASLLIAALGIVR